MRPRPAAIARVSIGALGVAVVAGAVVVSVTAEPKSTFFAGGGSLALILTAAGLCLLATGLLLLRLRPTWPSGPLLVLAAGLWFSPAWVAWRDGRADRALARDGRGDVHASRPRVDHRRIPGCAGRCCRVAVECSGSQARRLRLRRRSSQLSYDPFLDVGCWATCGDNALLIVSVPPLAETALIAAAGLGVFVLGFATVCALRDVAVRRSAPRVLSATGAAALLVGAALEPRDRRDSGMAGTGQRMGRDRADRESDRCGGARARDRLPPLARSQAPEGDRRHRADDLGRGAERDSGRLEACGRRSDALPRVLAPRIAAVHRRRRSALGAADSARPT